MKFTIHTDGGARGNPGPAASAFVIQDEEGMTRHQQYFYLGETTNNVAEYTAVVKALQFLANEKDTKSLDLDFYLDSKLVVEQLNGNFKIKQAHLQVFADEVFALREKFDHVSFSYVPRAENKAADTLVNTCLDAEA
jgi:ribonuclease HI